MKTTEALKSVFLLPGMPWGVDVFFGHNLYEVAQESNKDFVDVTHRFDPCKQYLVVWDRFDFRQFLGSMPQYDLLISNGDCNQYCWELKD